MYKHFVKIYVLKQDWKVLSYKTAYYLSMGM